jgi:hypothetical protein
MGEAKRKRAARARAERTEINLDNLTAALKAVYGQETEVALLTLRHWVRTHYDTAKATPEQLREVEEGLLKNYHLAEPLDPTEAKDLLAVYGRHFFETSTPEERAAIAVALGYTPIEYEIMGGGFSMRELMGALRIIQNAPDDFLIDVFGRYARENLGKKLPTAAMPQLLAMYRREPVMEWERAQAILKVFGVRILDDAKPEDLQIWKEVSGAREH